MSLFNDPPSDSQNAKEKKSLSLSEVRRLGKRKLLELVEPSIDALNRAIMSGDKDDYISVKAACAILDRTGFGVHSTITVDDKVDYSKLSPEELVVRAAKVKQYLDAAALAKGVVIEELRSDSNVALESTAKKLNPKSVH